MADDRRVYTGRIVKGKLHVKAWKALGLRDGPVVITVERARATRSLAQNAFWWSAVVPAFAEHCGYTPMEMHEVLKQELLPQIRELVNPKTGEVKEHIIGGSTRKLNKLEFCELIERAQQLGSEMGIYIPSPNEVVAA